MGVSFTPLLEARSALRSDPVAQSFILLGLQPRRKETATSLGSAFTACLLLRCKMLAFSWVFLLLYIETGSHLFQFLCCIVLSWFRPCLSSQRLLLSCPSAQVSVWLVLGSKSRNCSKCCLTGAL